MQYGDSPGSYRIPSHSRASDSSHHAKLGGEQLSQRAVEHRQPIELVERPHVELGILDDRLQPLRIAAAATARDRPRQVGHAPQVAQQGRGDQVAQNCVALGVVLIDVCRAGLKRHGGLEAWH
jgi:hypothetical protein